MPHSLVNIALQQLHLPTHMSKDNMIAGLQNDWFIPNLVEMVTMYLKECTVCQLYSPKPTLKVLSSTIPQPTGPFKALHIDFVRMIERCNDSGGLPLLQMD